MKLSSYSIQQIYKIVPRKNQFYYYILENLEIPQNRIVFYTNSLQGGKHLLVIKSTELQLKQAQSVFRYLGINDWQVYYKLETERLISSNFDKVPLFANAIDSFMLSSLN